ncbi:MAG: hypothetical protein WD737_03455 [Gemmatimonadota bacterium]
MAQEIRVQPQDPAAARAELEKTRARMSDTLDDIEGVLLRKRAHLQEQLDVGARVREKPLHAAGIALGVGLVLGLLTGGGRRGDDEDERAREIADQKAELWESRARRLLEIARVQEQDLEDLEDEISDYEEHLARVQRVERIPRDGAYDEAPSRWAEVRGRLADSLGGYVSDASHSLAESLRRRF